MSKLFHHFGTAISKTGKMSVRGAAVDKDLRLAAMAKDGQTAIILVALPSPMTKLEACKHIVGAPEFQTPAQQEAIQSYIDNKEPVKKVKAAKPVAPVAEADVDAANSLVDEEVADMKAEMKLTFEEALAQVPMREKGRFIKKEVREQMARDLMAA